MNAFVEMTVEMAREVLARDAETRRAELERKTAAERAEAIREAVLEIERIRSWPLGSYWWCNDARAVKASERRVAERLRERWGGTAVDELRAAVYATAEAKE